MKNVIVVDKLFKQYELGKKEKNLVFRDAIVNFILFPYRKVFKKEQSKNTYCSAIDGISFSVKEGEVVGIIGKNGAGKSTLLKILSRITDPTKGEIKIAGKLGSLIEVGTGFHQELTGRENIYLNGAILGMKKKEVKSRFNDIVDFSGIEKYLDMPVKKYSSGMYVRLAFAVAAHLDTDILLVDEVLSVGDAEFQQKSLSKVKDIASGGRTVLFVSHNMSTISQLCTRCIVISEGKIIFDGKPKEAISKYLSTEYKYFGKREIKKDNRKIMQIRSIIIANGNQKTSGILDIGKPIEIFVKYDVNKEVSNALVFIRIDSIEGTTVIKTTDNNKQNLIRKKGRYESSISIPSYLINVGKYSLSVGCEIADKYSHSKETFDKLDAFQFECVDTSGLLDDFGSGILAPKYNWTTKRIS